MQKIGQALQDRREELGYSLKDMSDKTRVPVAKLKALEEGDLKYFEQDITYVKFYVRYYCNAVHLNFELFKEELDAALDEYSNTTKMLKMVEIEEMHSRISERTQNPKVKKQINRTNAKGKRKIDVSFWTFIGAVSILVVALTLVFVFLIIPNLKANNVTENTGVETIPQPIDPNAKEETVTPVVEEKVLSLQKIDVTSYEISGFTEQQSIQFLINFKSNAYVKIDVDGVATSNPASKLYNVGSTLDLKLDAKSGSIVSMYIGWMNGNTIQVNNLEVPLDESIASKNGSVTLTFTFKGETQ